MSTCFTFLKDISCSITTVVADIDVDVVLGIDFMKNKNVTIDINRNAMNIQGRDFDLNCAGRIGCYRVVLAEQTVIPAMSEVVVKGKVTDPGIKRFKEGIIEPSERFLELDRGSVAKSLVTIDEYIPLRIGNFSEVPNILRPGTNIAKSSRKD